ncbi:DUF4924 family protein [Crocinitomix catalasitica]|uniref:DUF4924 family protein n=1 Tax=Crocinitomix catalasitica TaxID=184607 RepID=UPI0004876D25|nr:DUF4924 family protein [Crocinitomix catalasitica]
MRIANRTKEENIAEHVVYMFQIEDLIRANNLDSDRIIQQIIAPQIEDRQLIESYSKWYEGLVKQMISERIQKTGHLSDIDEILTELLLLHNTLINITQDKKYLAVFEAALPILKDFQGKSQTGDLNLIEVGFNALYGKIILKLQGKEITPASEAGFKLISNLLGHLAAYYKKMKAGDLDFSKN